MTDLRTIEDWQLERRFKAVPGVVDVNGWGGKSKTYDVTVDLKRLNDAGLTLAQVIQALNNNNLNVGGQTLNFGQHAAVVRGVALIQSMDAIRNTILSANGGNRRPGARHRRRRGELCSRASASPARTTTTISCRASC